MWKCCEVSGGPAKLKNQRPGSLLFAPVIPGSHEAEYWVERSQMTSQIRNGRGKGLGVM